MKKYAAIFRIRFANAMQYRAAAAAGLVTQFAWGFMEILAFSAFYRANPAAFPMEFSELTSYIWLQQAFLTLLMLWYFEQDIFNSITDGGIAYELARPVDLYNRWFCQSAANRLARAMLRSIPVLAVALLIPAPFRLPPPTGSIQLLLFVISLALALGVVIAFSMLIYISTFYTLSPTGLRLASAALVDFLAGSIIPLPFFPPSLRAVAELLPFASMQNMPLRIYSGNIAGTDALFGIGLQFLWLVVLVISGRSLMKNALRRVVIQGG